MGLFDDGTEKRFLEIVMHGRSGKDKKNEKKIKDEHVYNIVVKENSSTIELICSNCRTKFLYFKIILCILKLQWNSQNVD